MKDETVVFVIEDATSYRCLEPIADRLAAENEIRFLFLDALFAAHFADVFALLVQFLDEFSHRLVFAHRILRLEW